MAVIFLLLCTLCSFLVSFVVYKKLKRRNVKGSLAYAIVSFILTLTISVSAIGAIILSQLEFSR